MQDSKLRIIQPMDDPDGLETPDELMDEIHEDSERIAELEDLGRGGRREKALKYGVIASIVFHIIFFIVLIKLAYHTPKKSVLKPGEKVTKMRLVDMPPGKKEQPAPERFDALSDRNNIAKKKRLPKMPTGRPVPMRPAPPRNMAALTPPKAPEFPDKPKEKPKPKPKKTEVKPNKPKKAEVEPNRAKKPVPKKKPQDKPVTEPRRTVRSTDLIPTPSERMLAMAPPRAGAPSFFPEGDPDEAVVDLNTRAAGDFGSYMLHIKRKIQNVWVYPRAASEAGIAGTLRVEFVIAKDGKLLETRLLDSSGHAILDNTALNAIKMAGPYNPFPPRLKKKRLRVKANFIYHYSRFFGRNM